MATLVVPEPPIFKVAIFFRALNLVVPGRFRHLTKGVQGLPRPSCAHRMSAADQATAGVNRQLTTKFNHAVLDGAPRLTWVGKPEMIDGHILGGGKAIVGLNALHLPDIGQAGPLEGINNSFSRMGQHIGVAFALGDFGIKLDRCGAVTPAQNLGQTRQSQTSPFGVFFSKGFRG